MRIFKFDTRLLMVSVVVISILSMSIGVFAEPQKERKIIIFKHSTTESEKELVFRENGAVKVKDLSCIQGAVVYVPSNHKLNEEKSVIFIEDDYLVTVSSEPVKQPKVVPPPSMPAEVIPWGINWMDAPMQWNVNTGESIKVAVIDTGIALNHSDLKANIKGGINVISKKGTPNDDNGHGTHVAGIIAAVRNQIGVVGMAPDADLYAVKVLDSAGNGYVSDIITGISWCINNKMDILNMSFGIPSNSIALHDIITQANDIGIKMVAAAGNNYGGTAVYPAAYPEVISVGAIDQTGNIASFSAIQNVDMYAPGADIFSTYTNDGYLHMSGTSMAAPHYVGLLILK